MPVGILPACMFVYHVCTWCPQSLEGGGPLLVVNNRVVPGNQTQVLCKSSSTGRCWATTPAPGFNFHRSFSSWNGLPHTSSRTWKLLHTLYQHWQDTHFRCCVTITFGDSIIKGCLKLWWCCWISFSSLRWNGHSKCSHGGSEFDLPELR